MYGDGRKSNLTEVSQVGAVEWKPTDAEKLRSLGYMLTQAEDMRQQAQRLEMAAIEEIIDSACQEMLLVWAKLRKESRNKG